MINNCIVCGVKLKSDKYGRRKYCSDRCGRIYRNIGIPKGRLGSGYIYIIQSGDSNYYKIGQTTSRPLGRLQELQAGSPVELKMYEIFYVSNMSKAESQAHNLVHNKKVRGEWFELNQDDLGKVVIFLSK